MKACLVGLFLCLAILSNGCNGNITNPYTPLNPGSLTADYPDGTEFISSEGHVANDGTDYVVTATQDVSGAPADEITMQIPIPANSTVPFTVSSLPDDAIVTYYDAVTGITYEANSTQGSCTITVTQISPTFQGTFSARTTCSTTLDSVRTLQNGAFNANYQ